MADLKVVPFVPGPIKAASKLAAGDKVKLKSDSQPMTVRLADKDGVSVDWVTDLGEHAFATFLEEMLEPIPQKPKRKPRPKIAREVVFTPDPKPTKRSWRTKARK